MLSETLTVYSKYSYNLFILSNERLIFFRKNGDELNYEQFFSYYEWIIYKHSQLKHIYRNFKYLLAQIKLINYHYIIMLPETFLIHKNIVITYTFYQMSG